MQTKLRPYLNFKENTREVMEFYKSIFGGKLQINTFKELHASKDPSEDDLVMHSVLESDDIEFMASDTPRRMDHKPISGFSLSLIGDNETELRGYFEKLSSEGSITMPLQKAIWGDTFGMCIDKFGVSWLVNISPAPK